MQIIQAPNEYTLNGYTVFMAGGMGNTDWHEVFFDELKDTPLNILYPYNPNITDVVQQIVWEHTGLSNFDKFIFSCYFDKYTYQPVTMLELGKMLVLKNVHNFSVVVSFHKDAKLKQDVQIQCGLENVVAKERTYREHAQAVKQAYERMI